MSVCLPFQLLTRLTESLKRGVGVTCLGKIRTPYSQCLAVGSINRIDERNFLRRSHNIATSDPEVI